VDTLGYLSKQNFLYPISAGNDITMPGNSYHLLYDRMGIGCILLQLTDFNSFIIKKKKAVVKVQVIHLALLNSSAEHLIQLAQEANTHLMPSDSENGSFIKLLSNGSQ